MKKPAHKPYQYFGFKATGSNLEFLSNYERVRNPKDLNKFFNKAVMLARKKLAA